MKSFLLKAFLLATLGFAGTVAVFCQSADQSRPDEKDEAPAKSLHEQMVKMQIAREKKEYQEMLDRGDQVAKLGDEVEQAFEEHHTLSQQDLDKIDTIEKLVKKIRNELGGSDDDDPEDAKEDPVPNDVISGVKYLRDSTAKLLVELKKSSRFSISVAAIQTSNSTLKVARFLRIAK